MQTSFLYRNSAVLALSSHNQYLDLFNLGHSWYAILPLFSVLDALNKLMYQNRLTEEESILTLPAYGTGR